MASIVRSKAAPRYISHFDQSGVVDGFGVGGGCVGGGDESEVGAGCSNDDESDSSVGSGVAFTGGAGFGVAGGGVATVLGGDSVVKAPTALQAP